MKGWVIIKANLGAGDSLGVKEITVDEDRESVMSNASSMLRPQLTNSRKKVMRTG